MAIRIHSCAFGIVCLTLVVRMCLVRPDCLELYSTLNAVYAGCCPLVSLRCVALGFSKIVQILLHCLENVQ